MAQDRPFQILVVDDDKSMRQSLVDLIEAAGWQVTALSRAEMVQEVLPHARPDVILSDVRMPGMSGMDLLASLDPAGSPPVVLISAHGDIPLAVKAMQQGAYSFVEKPYEPRRLLTILRHAAQQARMAHSNQRLKARLAQLSGLDRILLGNSSEIQDLRRDILDFADMQTALLIHGDTGTGKELVARALHDLGGASGAPFLALNCAALSPDSFESEMFGVEGRHAGRLLGASGGTVFLDEVCACPPLVQAKLLRVIEDKQILPVGATRPVRVDFRVISATNEDTKQALADGRLRQDFLFRVNTLVLNLPPLSARRDDIALLAAHFLAEYARVHEQDPPVLTRDDIALALAHNWPGNVRELRNVCERTVLFARRGAGAFARAMVSDVTLEDMPDNLRGAVAVFERALISKAIQRHQGRMDDVAEALGIGRRTLNEKIVKLNLDKDSLL
ncbi:Fis family transcriptional regulator [Amylibacter marinus]|uniref:Fis family transcriptional regulator n=1 Tax=Amylibacter marinus TaxID=1475483 RepID=A0ABQ5VWR0_9RHOB|nr:sigma-54 dependent transcriptional regulator [Amylibacter marinus]GLQ35790.1 Fis family transcriptional regulator [Amylibacter marinus]